MALSNRNVGTWIPIFVVLAATGASHLPVQLPDVDSLNDESMALVNIGEGLSCEPMPSCSGLLDGDSAGVVAVVDSCAKQIGHSLFPDPNISQWELSAAGSLIMVATKVFLDDSIFVEYVVMHVGLLQDDYGKYPELRTLIVTTWTSGREVGSAHEHMSHDEKITVNTSAILLRTTGKIVVTINRTVMAIAIQWEALPADVIAEFRSSDASCDELPITELDVMAHWTTERILSPGDGLRVLPMRSANASSMQVLATGAPSKEGSNQLHASFLSPSAMSADPSAVSLDDMRFVIPVRLASAMAVFALLAWMILNHCHRAQGLPKDGAERELVVAHGAGRGTALVSPGDASPGSERLEAGTALPQLVHHYIGSDSSQPASPRSERGSERGSERCAQRAPSMPTESEPEQEMDPELSAEPTLASQHAAITLNAPVPVPPMVESLPVLPMGDGRVSLLYASPLCYKDASQRPVPLPQIPVEREWDVLVKAYDEATAALRDPCPARTRQWRRKLGVELFAQPLTAKSLQRAIAPMGSGTSATVLHISAHGVRDNIVMENGKGTAHFFGSDQLDRILDLRNESEGHRMGQRLVLLNACRLRAIGTRLADKGVPHVIGSSAELRDSASHVFLCTLYSCLFQGGTVAKAFGAAIVALRSHPEASTRAAADSFYLLPEDAAHDEVLFPACSVMTMPSLPVETKATVSPSSKDTPSGNSKISRSQPSASTTATGSSSDGPDDSCSSVAPSSTDNERERLSSDSDAVAASGSSRWHAARRAAFLQVDRSPVGVGERRRARTASNSTSMCGPRRRPAFPQRAVQTAAPVPWSPFDRAVPLLPEDFYGRTLDAWSVLQHVADRRAVVVCGASGESHGVGKSAVLDAVHRAFAFQMGGTCVSVHLGSLSEPSVVTCAFDWIEKVRSAVHLALNENGDHQRSTGFGSGPRPTATTLPHKGQIEMRSGAALRRRTARRRSEDMPVTRGFHPLSDPVAVKPALDELMDDMGLLSEKCEARCREWPAAGSCILLLLDECDHLIQQPHFQDAIAEVLSRCSSFRVILSTQQRMVGTGGGKFKVVHHELKGLTPKDSATLFLRRVQRPLRKEEIIPRSQLEPESRQDPLLITDSNREEVLTLVALHPVVKAQRGNPRGLIQVASLVGPGLNSLNELTQNA